MKFIAVGIVAAHLPVLCLVLPLVSRIVDGHSVCLIGYSEENTAIVM